MLFKIYQTPPKVASSSTPESPPTSSPIIIWKNYLLFSFFGLIFIVAAWKGVEFLELTQEGKVVLSQKRQKKLDKELETLEEAEQYVLLAQVSKDYPCYNCPGKTTIRLNPGEVWKYGVTTQGQKGRYGLTLPFADLTYRPQFIGTIEECLKEEKRKIYHYALLPENLKRQPPIIRPPGNKNDK